MNLDNRRLRTLQEQIQAYSTLIEHSTDIEECLTYQSKLDELEKEEKQILERCDVII